MCKAARLACTAIDAADTSCRLPHHARVGLKSVKIGDRALRVRRRREDEALIVG